MSQVADQGAVEEARAALARHEWQTAYQLLDAADASGGLGMEGLGLLAEAAWWVGRLPRAIDARERAYAAAMKSNRPDIAVEAAINLGRDNLLRNAVGESNGWLRRAERILEGQPEMAAHGWLAIVRGMGGALVGDLEMGLDQAMRAQEIGARFGDRDLEMMGISCRGVALMAKGEVRDALALMDEATVAAVGGELGPATAGGVCCATIEACTALGDWRRAVEWTEAQDRWCAREGINGFPGMCRLYRAEIKRVRGSWLEAEAEARHASDELAGFMPGAVGVAMYTIGEIRLRRGDLEAAEDALLAAHAHGREPQPALALLRLAQGRVAEANAAIARALDEPAKGPSWAAPPNSDLERIALLPARVEIALAAGDVEAARRAADELDGIAERFATDAVSARAAASRGAVLVAERDAAGAGRAFREAIRLWTSIDAPHDVASARLGLARAADLAGDRDRAVLEAEAARAAFEQLGAGLDVRAADALLAALGAGRSPSATTPAPVGRRSRRERLVRTFAFTDIVDSTRLADLLGDEAWDRLIRWHDRTLRTLVAAHGGEDVKAIGDGFFLAFADTAQAIDCAIAIQRQLAEHRREHGFAPAVRIGLHRAEATRAGSDYSGIGVNAAARIGASAAGDEIIVSAATLEGLGRRFAERGRRTVNLRGIAAPVELVSVAWA